MNSCIKREETNGQSEKNCLKEKKIKQIMDSCIKIRETEWINIRELNELQQKKSDMWQAKNRSEDKNRVLYDYEKYHLTFNIFTILFN